ncbi:MAG TPA: tRNA (adenosine(37)-N6)-threonylcarbamoyltransferase complex ATPase subunit type 1 TsaE [Candidatus Saccharibacteria bacterium]|nr:tRNA (adenosine(37)-N6)-threonylcarbamoyltransferase complex ATPase subunit type 1 TsaE [Candidatus Saccharibacteria bacterium]HRQ97784.1 tRNA (adenosine(37)-N6)-threonylcarbamoyltransferase complex ATPase subunit type 1 TsaE [Candidatus Saccharibacteria bacterium]
MIIEVHSEDEMKLFGERFATSLRGGDVVELIGDVGAGKTTLTKGIAKGLGVDEDVQSPSFTISRVYELSDNRKLAHYDFYRLNDAGIMLDELSETMADPDVITVIEWADVVSGVLPENRVSINLSSPSENIRTLTITGSPVRKRGL